MQLGSLVAVFARGMCMGIADLIPGVSGGTIAFISGIYQRLLAALSMFSKPPLWQALLRFDIRHLWQLADATFLLALLAGILSAVALFSGLLHRWLATDAHLLLGFFFGLVLASVIAIIRRLPRLAPAHWLFAAAAATLTFYLVTTDAVVLADTSKIALFIGGMIAICAMLLPGISGSYLLLILGLYPAVISAVHTFDIATLLVFVGGCICGLLLFARLLVLLLQCFYNATMAALIGIMIGALPKLWPWKQSGDGVKIILQPNVIPQNFTGDADIALVAVLALCGVAAVLLIDWLALRQQRLSQP